MDVEGGLTDERSFLCRWQTLADRHQEHSHRQQCWNPQRHFFAALRRNVENKQRWNTHTAIHQLKLLLARARVLFRAHAPTHPPTHPYTPACETYWLEREELRIHCLLLTPANSHRDTRYKAPTSCKARTVKSLAAHLNLFDCLHNFLTYKSGLIKLKKYLYFFAPW